jgi:hypothetical protein
MSGSGSVRFESLATARANNPGLQYCRADQKVLNPKSCDHVFFRRSHVKQGKQFSICWLKDRFAVTEQVMTKGHLSRVGIFRLLTVRVDMTLQ